MDIGVEVNRTRANTNRLEYANDCPGLVNRCKEALPTLTSQGGPQNIQGAPQSPKIYIWLYTRMIDFSGIQMDLGILLTHQG